jgi:hypothetical protein
MAVKWLSKENLSMIADNEAYQDALARIANLMDSALPNSPEETELSILADRVGEYERGLYPTVAPSTTAMQLQRMLGFAVGDGFSLFIAEVENPREAAESWASGVESVITLEEYLRLFTGNDGDVIHVVVGDGGSAIDALHQVNFIREGLPSCPCVFWLTKEEVDLLPRHAPDFWAWRSGVFLFSSDDEAHKYA